MKILVIGGVAAGMSAASKARRVNPSAEITVYEKGQNVSYGACGLPYYVSGLNPDPEKLLIRSVDEFAAQNITVRTGWEAVGLDVQQKQLHLREVATGRETSDGYDRLLVATGAAAVAPPIPGATLPGVHHLKTYPDGLRLRGSVQQAQKVVVVGGGYIGIELAESLQTAGKAVTVVEAAPDILAGFEPEIRDPLKKHMQEQGIRLVLGQPVTEVIEEQGRAAGVRTQKESIPADLVVLALGVKPATAFLRGCGFKMAPNGALELDRTQRTSLPDIWAAGDCATCYNRVERRNTYQALGTVANKCGRVAGANIGAPQPGGGKTEFEGALGSAALKVGGLEAARTGMGEETAKQLVGEIATSFVQANDRPQYYPGQTQLWIKLICEKATGRILGAQAVGEKGAVLRIDAVAAAITGGLTAHQLGQTDFCYAPPFAEAWDALNIAGNAVK